MLLHSGLGDHEEGGEHGEELTLAPVQPDEEHEDKLVGRLEGALRRRDLDRPSLDLLGGEEHRRHLHHEDGEGNQGCRVEKKKRGEVDCEDYTHQSYKAT